MPSRPTDEERRRGGLVVSEILRQTRELQKTGRMAIGSVTLSPEDWNDLCALASSQGETDALGLTGLTGVTPIIQEGAIIAVLPEGSGLVIENAMDAPTWMGQTMPSGTANVMPLLVAVPSYTREDPLGQRPARLTLSQARSAYDRYNQGLISWDEYKSLVFGNNEVEDEALAGIRPMQRKPWIWGDV